MEPSQTINLFVTYVDKEGPFLKVWGQSEKNNAIFVEQFLLGASPQFDQGIGKLSIENLHVGTLVCAKYKDNKYYRARIASIDYLNDCFVEVSFLDYGNRDIVPCANIRSLQNFPTSFISIPPLATGFIFAEAHCPGGGEWNEAVFDSLSKEVRYREVQCTLLIQATQYYLVKLFIAGSDLGPLFIARGLMQPISLQAQQAVLLSMSMQKKQQALPMVSALTTPEINTYKACTLEPGCQYPVYVSYVNDGPTHFSVQLKQTEDLLVKLMKEINSINLRMLEDIPLPGTICLARCQEDSNICRAVVTNEVDNMFKVFYVDFGNYEIVNLDSIFQIPFKYVLPKVMAIRFSLAGVEKSNVTIEMQCAFKKFVDNRLLYMKVLPSATRTAIPKCELWDPETKTSALDVLNRAATNAYPEPLSLRRGFTQPVKVSYVFSCNRFYVQLVSKENELTKLMMDLQISCQCSDPMDPADIKVGLPCCALFEGDGQWYRSEIVEVVDGYNVKVRYIDYGNEEIVQVNYLKLVEGELLTVLIPQAIECCLNGYQNMDQDLDRDTLLEELILEQQFTMKVAEMMGKKALVELIDGATNYNVASLLLDKIASATSQVSPMLVQAGNKIEHRKSLSNGNGRNDRSEHKPGRETNTRGGWHDKSPNEKSWRQEKDNRFNDVNSNERGSPDDNSWRQNNKGFKNNDRFNNRDDRFNNDTNRNRNNWNKDSSPNQNDDNSGGNELNDRTITNDGWNSTAQKDSGYNKGSRDGYQKGPRDDFGRKNDRFDNDKGGNWNSNGPKRDGYKGKSDLRRDGSELSPSGSESGFQKGPRTSSRNDKKFPNKYDKPKNASFGSTANEDSWNVSAVTAPIDAAPNDATFIPYNTSGTEAKIVISWFHNPAHFYCQLTDVQAEFKTMMEDIQQFYKNRKPESAVAGAPVIGLFPEDNVLYRAQVLEALGTQYKVFYVDFGNISTITKVWPIEKKFMNLPAQAICCGLSGIAPPAENWPNADNYSKYFEKESFFAKFLSQDEERAYVSLLDESQEIAQLLVQDGLAVSLLSTQGQSEVELPILLGQQFRVVLKSINNLSDIIVALECGLALGCKMHNLETAIDTFEDTLKGYLEQTVIVYVDNVLEDSRLDVTIYDTEGNKLNVLNPDEGAFDAVEPLCPPLILTSTIYGCVSHTQDNQVFIQPAENTEPLTYLLEQMFEFYENQTQESTIIPEEGLVYAVHSEDTNWYRARVTNFNDEKATVCYVDYGNSESVLFSEIRELDSRFLVPHILCVQVTVSVPAETLAEKDVFATIYFGESGWEGTVQEMTVTEPVQPVPETSSPIQAVPETSLPIQTEESAIPLAEGEPDQGPVAPQVEGIPVYVSHVDTPNEFYMQLSEALTEIQELQDGLQEAVEAMPVLENITAGVLCAAPYSADQQWYRAEVLDADADITTVRFVDYGNTDVIDNSSTQIKTLPTNLLSLAVYATRCSLKIKPTEEEWSTAALETFEQFSGAENMTAQFVDQDEKTNYVELFVDGQNVKDILIGQNVAVGCESAVESKSTCFLSHLNSPSEFWIQLENCVDELEWIAEQLSGAESFPELEELAPGTLCAALFPDDEMWYRARILSNTVAGIELLFIDYGNSSMSGSLRQLPEELVITPPLAQKCSLQRPAGLPYWSQQAIDKFNELSAEGQTIFTVKKIGTGETAVVELSMNGEDVVSKLLPETYSGSIRNFVSLNKFNVEQNGEVLKKEYKLECIPGMTWTDESAEKFAELNREGTTQFEIEFHTEDTVRLYIEGQDIRPQLGGIKAVPQSTSTENDKTDQLLEDTITNEEFLSADTVIDYQAGGDNLEKEDKLLEEQIYKHSSDKSVSSDSQFCDSDTKETTSINKSESTPEDLTPDSLLETEEKTQKGVNKNSETDKVMQDQLETVEKVEESNKSEGIDHLVQAVENGDDLKEKPKELAGQETEVEEHYFIQETEEKTPEEVNKDPETDKGMPDQFETVEKDEESNNSEEIDHLVQAEKNDVCVSAEVDKTEDTEDKSEVIYREIEVEKNNGDKYEESASDKAEKDSGSKAEVSDKPAEKITDVEKGTKKIEDKPKEVHQEIEVEQNGGEKESTGDSQSVKVNKTEDTKEIVHEEIEKESDKAEKVDSVSRAGVSDKPKVESKSKEEKGALEPESCAKEPQKSLRDSEVTSLLEEALASALDKKEKAALPTSRPQSRNSGKYSHDERIVPAVLSRPQSPMPSDNEDDEQNLVEK